jgi:hypothetical protein
MQGLVSAIKKLFKKHHDLVERVEKADHQTRESKHKLRNLAMRTQHIHQLFSQMKEDDLWRRGANPGRDNDKRN